MFKSFKGLIGAGCVTLSAEEAHTVIGALQRCTKWDEEAGLLADKAAIMAHNRRKKLLEAIRLRLPKGG